MINSPRFSLESNFMIMCLLSLALTFFICIYHSETDKGTHLLRSDQTSTWWKEGLLESVRQYKPQLTHSIPENKKTLQALSQHWQQAGNTKDLYVYSAYYEEDEHIVKVIGIALHETKVKCTCKLYSSDQAIGKENNVDVVNGTLKILPEDNGQTSVAVFIRCPLEKTAKPAAVGIMVENITKYLRVTYPTPRRYNFTVCLPCLHGPYKDPFRIIEMVEADMIFGAEHFIVYNHSISPEVDKVLRHYEKRGLMKVVPWNLPEVKIHYFGQMASIQDCTLASRQLSKYLVLKDLDELIVPRKHRNWHQLMKELDKDASLNASFLFRNTFFWSEWGQSLKDFKKGSDVVLLKIICLLDVWREKLIYPSYNRTKVMVRPERIALMGIHFPFLVKPGYNRGFSVDSELARVHHYRRHNDIRMDGKGKLKDDIMRTFADGLINNVNKTLSGLGYTNLIGNYVFH